MGKVIEEIAAERKRQITREGWSIAHDDQHLDGELAHAAAAYATTAAHVGEAAYRHMWPWRHLDDMRLKHPRRRQLIIAAALIVAEIERLDRVEAHEQG